MDYIYTHVKETKKKDRFFVRLLLSSADIFLGVKYKRNVRLLSFLLFFISLRFFSSKFLE